MRKLICAAALIAIGTCGAAEAATDPAACLEPIRFYGWKPLNDQAVIITDKLHHDFKVSLRPGCHDLDFSFGLAVRSFSTSRLSCVDRGDTIIVPRQIGEPRQTCWIEKVEAYTPEMAHADALAKAAAKSAH